jgi:uncharacterized protein (DUF433 family)
MAGELSADPLPLRVEPDGGIRVRVSRVHLELVIAAYENGATAEEIAASYDTLDLADIYTVLGYYLRHRDEMRNYVEQRDREAGELQHRLEANGVSRPTVWQELRARRAQTEKVNAPSGD